MHVLVVDDDEEVRSVLTRALVRDGHLVQGASTLADASNRLEGIDLIVLDLGLPDGSGLELCRGIRAQKNETPILILTAQSQVSLRVQGLDAGADDYLAKPFAIAELRARVRALGRRSDLRRNSEHPSAAAERNTFYISGHVHIDFSKREAQANGNLVPITSREWAILETLASRRGRVLSRYDLLDAVWGENSDAAMSSMEVLIARLRKKLGPEIIRTLRGEGYSMHESADKP